MPKSAKKRKTNRDQAEINFINSKNCLLNKTHLDWERIRPFDFPFIRQLLQQPKADTLAPCKLPQLGVMRRLVQKCTRQHDELFLEEPGVGERPCAAAADCEGLQLHLPPDQLFIPKEFLLPNELLMFQTTKQLPCEQRLCLLCKRTEIAKAFLNIKSDDMGVKHGTLLQDFRNITNVPGEYLLRDCILSSSVVYQGLVDPIVLHNRNAFRRTVTPYNKKKYIQWRYASAPERDPRQATK